jgi:hypothetical protein
MKAKVTLRFRDFHSNPDKAWSVGGSSWTSDQKRISATDLEKMFKHALEHTLAMVAPGDELVITLETHEA